MCMYAVACTALPLAFYGFTGASTAKSLKFSPARDPLHCAPAALRIGGGSKCLASARRGTAGELIAASPPLHLAEAAAELPVAAPRRVEAVCGLLQSQRQTPKGAKWHLA